MDENGLGEQFDFTVSRFGLACFPPAAYFAGYFDYALGFEFGKEIGQRLVFGIEHDLCLSLPIPEVRKNTPP